jgi:hypothetical protein
LDQAAASAVKHASSSSEKERMMESNQSASSSGTGTRGRIQMKVMNAKRREERRDRAQYEHMEVIVIDESGG